VHLRGNHLTLGDVVQRRLPKHIAPVGAAIGVNRSGRFELAEWLIHPANPLTSRVIVNRVWNWHFGRGIIATPDNFGNLGSKPSHPELLDWLAADFVKNGWSIKGLHKTIMLSATYQSSTGFNMGAFDIDPENTLHWRANRRRLDAEELRDALLYVSGDLNRRVGGIAIDAENRKYVPGYPNTNYDQFNSDRRSVYLPVIRSMGYDVLQAFDFPDPSTSCGNRCSTTVATQSLMLMNSDFVFRRSLRLAESLLNENDASDTQLVQKAFHRILGRAASEREVGISVSFLKRLYGKNDSAAISKQNRVAAWQSFCRSLFSTNEFLYVD
jgi:hypothetical protein